VTAYTHSGRAQGAGRTEDNEEEVEELEAGKKTQPDL
jgi:hypothetical protein